MDVASILANAAEDAYEDDNDFEDQSSNLQETLSSIPTKPNMEKAEESTKPIHQPGRSILDTLKESAVTVKKEDVAYAKEVLQLESREIVQERREAQLEANMEVNNNRGINSSRSTSPENGRFGNYGRESGVDRLSMESEKKTQKDRDDDDDNNQPEDDDGGGGEEDEEEGENDLSDHSRKKLHNITFLAAIYHGDKKLAQQILLQEEHVSVTCQDRHGWTASHWAASKGYEDVLSFILDLAKKQGKHIKKFINRKEHTSGWTALHLACIHCHVSSIKILKIHGAKLNMKNKLNEYPVDCIGNYKNADMVYDLVQVHRYDDSYSGNKRLIDEQKDMM